MLRFTCGERKICSTINKSQNIMNMIVTVSAIKTGNKTVFLIKMF